MDIFNLVEQINENIKHYKILTEANAQEIIKFIKDIVIPVKIRICYEHLSCIERIREIKQKFIERSAEKFEEKTEHHFQNINSAKDIITRFRFILSTNRNSADFAIPLVRQCNGVIIVVEELETGLNSKIITLSSNEFNPKFNQTKLADHISIGEYKIYEIQDGTTINLYYDENYISSETLTKLDSNQLKTFYTYKKGDWIYSTKNSFDVKKMIWRGFEYGQVINDVLKEYPEFTLEKLSKDKSYSLGFKHPAFHPFGQPAEWNINIQDNNTKKEWIKTAWFIQSTCITEILNNKKIEEIKNKEGTESEIKTKKIKDEIENEVKKEEIKKQYMIIKNTEEYIGLPLQKIIEPKGSISNIFKKLRNSLQDFLFSNETATSAFLGLILRSVDESKTLEHHLPAYTDSWKT